MSGKISKWKEVNSTSERLNRMLSSKPSDLPTRFAPKRDRSESSDKLFNNSRSRIHSSFELTALNKTRQQQFHVLARQRQFLELKKPAQLPWRREQAQRREQAEKRSAVLPPHSLGERRSTQILEPSQCLPARSSLLIAEIKKEYLSFKKNVLAELERQREMVQKMLKEIVLTFQYELQKAARLRSALVPSTPVQPIQVLGYTKEQAAKEAPKVKSIECKSIEQWKSNLEAVTIAGPFANSKPTETQVKREQSRPSQQRKEELEPPKLPLNLDSFLGSLAALKKQMGEMERILDQPQRGLYQQMAQR